MRAEITEKLAITAASATSGMGNKQRRFASTENVLVQNLNMAGTDSVRASTESEQFGGSESVPQRQLSKDNPKDNSQIPQSSDRGLGLSVDQAFEQPQDALRQARQAADQSSRSSRPCRRRTEGPERLAEWLKAVLHGARKKLNVALPQRDEDPKIAQGCDQRAME